MSRKALEWAQRLRGELAERIEELRVVLADIEPLQEELLRLEAQLEGVERLIGLYVNQLGVARTAVVSGKPKEEIALQPGADVQPVSGETPSLGAATRAFGKALRHETALLIARCGQGLQAVWTAGRLWLITALQGRRSEQ
jgi:hypothetical protein